MTSEIIIAIAHIPLVLISYGIGWHGGYKNASKTLKEIYELLLKLQEGNAESEEESEE